jgi:sulfur carrier protein
MSGPIRVRLNGAAREFPAPLTFLQLLDELALAGRRLAVERNGEIVPRSRFGETRLADGDRIEVVVAVGGG